MVIQIGCYKPMYRVEDTWEWVKAEDGHKYHPAKIISDDRLENYDRTNTLGRYKYAQIPCKKCIGCRLDYSREWANRGYLQSLESKHNYFVTLTLDEDHIEIPEYMETDDGITYTEIEEEDWKGTLVPKDFTQFIKSLRQLMKREYGIDGIKFMGCGEYGSSENTRRPHYHIILFDCPLPVESFYNPRVNWEKNVYYQNEIIERVWKKGISNITEATWSTIAYVARYITKKVTGEKSDHYYAEKGQEKEFFRTSRNPGIGRTYYEKNKDIIYKYDKILIENKKGSHWCKPPKYFDKLYEQEHPERMEEIKNKRKKDMINNLIVKGQTTSLTRWEQLQIEMETKEQVTKTLQRSLD